MSVKSEARSRSGRRNRSKRRGTSHSPAHLAPGSTAIRLAAGIVSLGIDELKTRLATIPEATPSGEPSRKGKPRNKVRPTAVNVATGLAIVSMTQATRLVAVARDAGALAGAEVGRFRAADHRHCHPTAAPRVRAISGGDADTVRARTS